MTDFEMKVLGKKLEEYETIMTDVDNSFEIESLPDEVFSAMASLFTSQGPKYPDARNFQNVTGYRIFPGDRDSFGWLVACIQKGDGPIWTFG